MQLANEQYEFIKGEVIALFERYDIRCIPINGFEIAYKMGMKLIPYSSLSSKKLMAITKSSQDGLYIEDLDGNDLIYYNDKTSYARMNMTILHEIGHCVLDHQGINEAEEEAEARFFAKYAVAPPPLVHRISPKCSEELGAIFHISRTAAIYAYDYYQKWLAYSGKYYTDYEMKLLQLFAVA